MSLAFAVDQIKPVPAYLLCMLLASLLALAASIALLTWSWLRKWNKPAQFPSINPVTVTHKHKIGTSRGSLCGGDGYRWFDELTTLGEHVTCHRCLELMSARGTPTGIPHMAFNPETLQIYECQGGEGCTHAPAKATPEPSEPSKAVPQAPATPSSSQMPCGPVCPACNPTPAAIMPGVGHLFTPVCCKVCGTMYWQPLSSFPTSEVK